MTSATTDRYIDPNSIVQDPSKDLDHDDPAALLDELTLIACSQGIRGDSRADRIHRLGRVTYLAGRLVWLESTSLHREELEAKYPTTTAPKYAVHDFVQVVKPIGDALGMVGRISGYTPGADQPYQVDLIHHGHTDRACFAEDEIESDDWRAHVACTSMHEHDDGCLVTSLADLDA